MTEVISWVKEARLLIQFIQSLCRGQIHRSPLGKGALLVGKERNIKHITKNEHFAKRKIYWICERVLTWTNDLAGLYHLIREIVFCNNVAKWKVMSDNRGLNDLFSFDSLIVCHVSDLYTLCLSSKFNFPWWKL